MHALWLALALCAPLPQEEGDAPIPTRLGIHAATISGTVSASGASFASDGGLWVCDTDGRRVVKYVDGAPTVELRLDAHALPTDVSPRGDTLFVSVLDSVLELALDGRVRRQFGTWGRGPGQLRLPGGIALAGEFLYVADTGNDRVQRFELATGAVTSCGEYGHSEGQFVRPTDVAVDESGSVYVTDTGNHRVVKLDRELRFVKAWGDFGPHPGFFSQPAGVAWHAGELFVIDTDNHRVQVFDADGGRRYEWGLHALLPREGDGKLHYPRGIAVRDGLAAVTEPFEDRVQLFRRNQPGEEVVAAQVMERVVSAHYGGHVSVAGDLAVLCEPTAPSFVMYDVLHELAPWEPVLVARTSSWGRRAGQMLAPNDAEVDWANRRLYLADVDARRVSVWSFEHDESRPLEFDFFKSRLVRSLDLLALHELGLDAAQEAIRPDAIELGPKGQLIVLDTLQRALFSIAPDLASVRRLDSGLGVHPVDLAWSPTERRLWVLDDVTSSVTGLRFDGSAGELASERVSFGTRAEFLRPSGIAVAADASLFVVDAAFHRVTRLDTAGRVLGHHGHEGIGALEFHKPRGVDVDEQGRVWVVDWGNHRAQVLSGDGQFIAAFGARAFVRPTLGGK